MKHALIAILPVLVAAPALATPTAAEIEAVELHCRTDVETLCKGVEHKDGKLKACLMENKDRLSAGCKTALEGLNEG